MMMMQRFYKDFKQSTNVELRNSVGCINQYNLSSSLNHHSCTGFQSTICSIFMKNQFL